jgi:methylase of polypeptide subunit release factors
MTATGVDVSASALRLAQRNLHHNVKKGNVAESAVKNVVFEHGNVLSSDVDRSCRRWDVVVSNPPYISARGFDQDTARSVRNWEPKLALVPPRLDTSSCEDPADVFYPPVLNIANKGGARVVLMEVSDIDQATRVAKMAVEMKAWSRTEVWRDWPDQSAEVKDALSELILDGERIVFKGEGHGRAVVCWA